MSEEHKTPLDKLREAVHDYHAERKPAVAKRTEEHEFDDNDLDSEDWEWLIHRNDRD